MGFHETGSLHESNCPDQYLNKMSIANILFETLPPDGVILDLEVNSRASLFNRAGEIFEQLYGIPTRQVVEHLLERERLETTALGSGVAVPHARIDLIDSAVAVAIRLRSAIPFDAPDNHAVSLFVFLLVPQVATQRHLEILAKIAEKLSDPSLRSLLDNAKDVGEFHDILCKDA